MTARLLLPAMAFILYLPAPSQVANRRTELSGLASGLLQQAEIARQALANRDLAGSRDHVRQALANAARIRELTGPAEEPLFVPMSMEFESTSTIVPAARNGSAERLKRNASVSEVTGDYRAFSLNVSSARAHLEAAMAAMEKGDTEAARADLAAVQSDVVTKTYAGEFPLVQARENLAIARARVQDGKYKDAVLPLNSAARALDRWAHQEPRPKPKVADRAMRMSVQINAYAERIVQDHADAADRVTGWWEQVTDWFNSGMPLQ